jgi:hypothetical protein
MRRISPVEEVWFPWKWFMKGSHRTGWFGLSGFICLALVTRPAAVSPNVVISQVYGGAVIVAPPSRTFHQAVQSRERASVAERVVAPVRECDRDWQLRRDQRAAHDAARRRPPARSVPRRLEARDPAGPPVCSIEVSSNEPTDGRGDGHMATDRQVLGAHAVLLRAERNVPDLHADHQLHGLVWQHLHRDRNGASGCRAETGRPAGWGSGG